MWIKSITVRNYRSFADTGEQQFARHVNFVVGKNNAGKTAFLQAAAGRINHAPNKNMSTRSNVMQPSTIEFVADVTKAESL